MTSSILSAALLASIVALAPKGCSRADDTRPPPSASPVASTAPPPSAISAKPLATTAAPAPSPAPAPAPAPAPSAASADTKEYCKKMYGKAYMLCGRDDHTCKFLAADHRQRCEQTGRWP